jgi:hypothetical protein
LGEVGLGRTGDGESSLENDGLLGASKDVRRAVSRNFPGVGEELGLIGRCEVDDDERPRDGVTRRVVVGDRARIGLGPRGVKGDPGGLLSGCTVELEPASERCRVNLVLDE